MKYRFLLTAVFFICSNICTVSATSGSPVPVDPLFRTGTLSNGLTYYIRYNNLPGDHLHFVLVQKPNTRPFFHQVLNASESEVRNGLVMIANALREQRITAPNQYRPHLQGIIVVGPVNPDSTERVLNRMLSELPASVDVLKAQDVPRSIDSAIAARLFTARPLPPFLQNGFPVVGIRYPLPSLSREQRNGSEYYVMDFLRYVLLYTARGRLSPPAGADLSDGFVWESTALPGREGEIFCDLAGMCIQMAREGITREEFLLAARAYLRKAEWDYLNRNSRTHEYYINQCIEQFFGGFPMPSAEWKYRFIKEMVPYVSEYHANRFIKGILYGASPVPEIRQAVTSADSLLKPVLFLPGELMEERDRLTGRISAMLFPYNDTELTELTARVLDIELRLQLDSLERNRVEKRIDTDSLRVLLEQARHSTTIGKIKENEPVTEPAHPVPSGRVERRVSPDGQGVSIWQLSGGSLLYIRPDTLSRGKVCFAAVERAPEFLMPFIPREVFRKGNGPLDWSMTPGGLVLTGETSPVYLESFLKASSRQVYELLDDPSRITAFWKEREQQMESARELSRTILLDSLGALLYDRRNPGMPSVPGGFDFICTGDISLDSLELYAGRYLAGMPNKEIRPRQTFPRSEGVRRGIHESIIPFPNPAGESKFARVYSGPCPYTLEQHVLLRLLERLVADATDHSAWVETSLEFRPRGHYYFYTGFAVPASDAAYNRHQFDQVLTNLAAYGPTEEQLGKAKKALLVEYRENLPKPEFHCHTLIRYSQSGRDFMTGYEPLLQQTDSAIIRDFVRQILEFGNSFTVELSGATNYPTEASYSKNP